MKDKANRDINTHTASPLATGPWATFYVNEEYTYTGHEIYGLCPNLKSIAAEVLFATKLDPDVRVVLVDRGLLVTYTDCDPTWYLNGGQCPVRVQETISIGYVNHTPQIWIKPCFWTMQYTDDLLLPQFRAEILTWWSALPETQRDEILTRFDDSPKVNW